MDYSTLIEMAVAAGLSERIDDVANATCDEMRRAATNMKLTLFGSKRGDREARINVLNALIKAIDAYNADAEAQSLVAKEISIKPSIP